MTKVLSATYEHGQFRPQHPLGLAEHQQVLLVVSVPQDDTPGILMSTLAEKSESFRFLDSPLEDIYSPADGEKI